MRRRAAELAAFDSGDRRRRNAARLMFIFVVIYVLQWWSPVVYDVWAMVAEPPDQFLVVCVFFVNLGGVYNCFAYTLIRRRLHRRAHDRRRPLGPVRLIQYTPCKLGTVDGAAAATT